MAGQFGYRFQLARFEQQDGAVIAASANQPLGVLVVRRQNANCGHKVAMSLKHLPLSEPIVMAATCKLQCMLKLR